MPRYTFLLRDGHGNVEDRTGVALRSRRQARRYAEDVVHELMRGREKKTRHWRLDVLEDGSETVFQIPFISVDETMPPLSAEWRKTLVRHCDSRRGFAEAMHDMVATIRESRALVARSRGKLYLAAEFGKSVIR